jgi:hypothetical protein
MNQPLSHVFQRTPFKLLRLLPPAWWSLFPSPRAPPSLRCHAAKAGLTLLLARQRACSKGPLCSCSKNWKVSYSNVVIWAHKWISCHLGVWSVVQEKQGDLHFVCPDLDPVSSTDNSTRWGAIWNRDPECGEIYLHAMYTSSGHNTHTSFSPPLFLSQTSPLCWIYAKMCILAHTSAQKYITLFVKF